MYTNDDILGREQAGFREGYRTIDHAFVLHLVIELYQSVRKSVFCVFIYYRKSFDSIDGSLLWQKLLSYNINGKVFNIIRKIYSKAKSCFRKDNMISDYCMCNIGVRQGDNYLKYFLPCLLTISLNMLVLRMEV